MIYKIIQIFNAISLKQIHNCFLTGVMYHNMVFWNISLHISAHFHILGNSFSDKILLMLLLLLKLDSILSPFHEILLGLKQMFLV